MSDVAELIQAAVKLHQGGQLERARQMYQQILTQDPRNANALNLFGLVGWQTGQFAEAVEHLQKAIAIDSSQAAFFGNLAEARRGLGQFAEAIQAYEQAARMQPNTVIIHLNLGTVLQQAGQVDQSIASYGRALELDPQNTPARYHLGTAFEQQGKLHPAGSCYQQILDVEPDHVPSLVSLAGLRKKQGNLGAAAMLYERALKLEPKRAVRHFDRGNVYQLDRNWTEAIACYRTALELEPDYAAALCNLANALREDGQLDEALIHARRAVELLPQSAEAHSNLGVVFHDSGRLAEAQSRFERAMQLDPSKPEFPLNLGTLFKDQGHVDRAIEEYDRALQLQSDYGQALCSRGMALLSLGRFAAGWAGYEHRIGLPQFDTFALAQPWWDGGPLAGRTLLVHCEQGLGDTLQFIRYLKLVRERAGDGKIIVAAQGPLLPLLAQSGFSNLVSREQPLPPFDVHVPLMSLPMLFKTEIETIPREIPYLAVDPVRVVHWHDALTKYQGIKVGIAWQGRKTYRDDRRRSIPLLSFAPLADVSGVQLVSLQKGPGVEQVEAVAGRFEVRQLGDAFDSAGGAFMDAAAVMKNLDLVVTSDTAIAHLAGALGVRAWVALSRAPDWRWMLDREDSPWYPGMRLFRQSRQDQWSDVFQRIAGELRSFSHST